jgi:hypothetical protein
LKTANLLHFVGHGWRDAVRPQTSGLCLAPRENAMWLRVGPLLDCFDFTSAPEQADGGRSRVLPKIGRITEWREDAVVRRLVETAYETFLGQWAEKELRFATELLTAEELATTSGVDNCALAVLMACDTGPLDPGHQAVREPSGLPHAFRLAGVPTVVATAWVIHEAVSVVFSELFYTKISGSEPPASRTGTVDIAAAVGAAVRRLRTLDREEAACLLRSCAAAARGADAFRLQEWARRLSDGPEQPFSDVTSWAAFYVTGPPVLSRVRGSAP